MVRLLSSLAKKIGIDGSIFFTILARSLQALGSVFTIFLISGNLSKVEQGYYYTFGSILAIQIFFELGLNGIIAQFVAHEAAHLNITEDLDVTGEAANISRLSSLLRFCLKWFGVLSIVLFISLLIFGNIFFTRYGKGGNVSWQRPWFFLALGSSLMLFVDPVLGFLEGLGKVKDVARIRLGQQSIFLATMIIMLSSGGKLYSGGIALISAFLVIVTSIFLSPFRKILWNILKARGATVVNYGKEIFPYQWRIAVSWVSGYFIFQLFNPVLFATEGPLVAGQMGMTLAAFNGISSLSMSWISTKVPTFSKLIARRNFTDLDSLFNRTFKQAQLVNAVGVGLFILGLAFLRWKGVGIAERFLPIYVVGLLGLVTFINQMVFAWATYLRCHKKEPFLIQSMVTGGLCAISTLCLGKFFGLNGIVGGYAVIIIFISMTWAFTMFKTKRALWH